MTRSTDLPSATEIALREAKELLRNDPKFCKRKVRCVVQEDESDPRVLAVFNLAVGRKFHWTPQDWKVITDTLDIFGS